jgi:iron-sulfur cluster insertion protein
VITLTEKAIAKLNEIAESEGIENKSVRVKLIGNGCAGFSQDMSFETNIRDTDEVIEQDGIKIICDPISLQYLEGTVIDYFDSMISSGFKFNIPAAKSTCGCGKSVSF